MTINELCSHFDKHEIVNTQLEIDRDYYAAMSAIYSDGEVNSHINREGHIHITSVHNASYIIFVDREYDTCLCVYKYIPEIMCKYIIENLHTLQCIINKSDEYLANHTEPVNIVNDYINDDVIDINIFTCVECGSKEKMAFFRSNTNPEALETKCNNCKAEYVFVPSKYYKMSSKRVIYFKSEESSRQIEIAEHSKPDIDIATTCHSAI